METRPRKGVLIEEVSKHQGVLIEEVSKHQETLALAGLGEVFKSQRAA